MTAPVAGGGVLDMERDARTIYDIACIREEGQSATREDVEFKAIALRNFNSVSAVAELIAAADCFSAAMAEDSSYLRDILDGIRPLERGSFVESLNRLHAALRPFSPEGKQG